MIQSWDTACKVGQHNDPSVCTTWYISEKGVYLRKCYRERLLYPQLKQAAIELAEKHRVAAVLIEDASSGQSLIQDLQVETNLPIIPIKPVGDKETRMRNVIDIIEAGRVFIPREGFQKWVAEAVQEMSEFPHSIHDDIVDSISQFLGYYKTYLQYSSQSRNTIKNRRNNNSIGLNDRNKIY